MMIKTKGIQEEVQLTLQKGVWGSYVTQPQKVLMQIPEQSTEQEHIIKQKPSWDDLVKEELKNPEQKDLWFQDFTKHLWEENLVKKKPIKTKPFYQSPAQEASWLQHNEHWLKFAEEANKKKRTNHIGINSTMSSDGYIVLKVRLLNDWHIEQPRDWAAKHFKNLQAKEDNWQQWRHE